MIDLAHLVRSAAGRMRCFRRDERGSMAIMMGLAAVPIIFSVGAGIDYGTANASAQQRPTSTRSYEHVGSMRGRLPHI